MLDDLQVLFDGQLGKYKLKIMEGAKPIFVEPRPVPFAFKDQVSKQLEVWQAQQGAGPRRSRTRENGERI